MAQNANTSAKPALKTVKPLDLSKLTTDLPKLGKEIDSARIKAARILDGEFQRLALSAILAVREHGNVHYVNAVWKALPKGARHDAMTKWLLAFGGVSVNVDKTKAKEMPFAYASKDAVDIDRAAAQPWTTFAPSKPVEDFSVLAQLQKILKTVDAGKRTVIATEAHLTALRELAEAMEAEASAGSDADAEAMEAEAQESAQA